MHSDFDRTLVDGRYRSITAVIMHTARGFELATRTRQTANGYESQGLFMSHENAIKRAVELCNAP